MPELSLMQVKSFSLIELLITIIVIGVALTFAIPSYNNSIERNKAKSAKINLMSIYNAQKRQRLDTGSYYVCDPNCTDKKIKNNLDVDLTDVHFDYNIKLPAGKTSGYEVIATRSEGPCAGQTMSIDDSSGEVTSTCAIWD